MIVAASFDIKDPENWNNRALQYGDGVFETMRFHRTDIPLWEFHQKRLKQGLDRLNLSAPDLSEILTVIKQQCISKNQFDCVVKLVVFRTHQARSYQAKVNTVEWFVTTDAIKQQNQSGQMVLAVADIKLSKQTLLAGIKHLNRLEQVLIANELNQNSEVDDLLVLDQDNHVVETSYQNIVLIKNNQLYTPKIKHCGVKGVALKWLKQNFEVKAKNIKFKDIQSFDGLMVCNSIRGFRLVSELVSVESFVTSHPVHDKIAQQWKHMFK